MFGKFVQYRGVRFDVCVVEIRFFLRMKRYTMGDVLDPVPFVAPWFMGVTCARLVPSFKYVV